MTDHQKDVQRAREAKEVLENHLVQDAFKTIRETLLAKWEASKANDKDGREEAWKMLHAMNEFKRYFESIIQTGKVAEHELTRLEKMQQRVSSIFK